MSSDLFSSTQLLAMAGFDLTTASFILAERGAGNVGIALLMNLIPGLVPMAAAYMTAFLVRNRGRRPLGYYTLLINSFLWCLSLYVAPWRITVAAVFLAVFSMPKNTHEGDGNPSRFDRVMLLMSASTVGLALAAIVTSSANILPTENLTPSGEKTFAGIVLGEDDPEMVVLRFEDRQVVRIAAKGTTRVPCRSVTPLGLPGGSRSIMRFREQEPGYPGCLRSSR
jgi:hypothetical protein